MGEEVKMSEYESNDQNIENDDERVTEWEIGLPTGDDLTPLSQLLIPPELASAFSISPEPHRTLLEVSKASQSTLSNLRAGAGGFLNSLSSNNFKPLVGDGDDPDGDTTINGGGSSDQPGSKLRRLDSVESDSNINTNNNNNLSASGADDMSSTKTVKRPRLVWTPQLHKRFVDVVGHLGIKNAVPKTIMQLMNVEGLTRENVASHLQKYRLYLKRMQGLSTEGPTSSDQLFASTPVPQSLHESNGNGGGGGGGVGVGVGANGNGNLGVPINMGYNPGAVGMMPVIYGHMGMHNNHNHHNNHSYNHHQNNGFDGNVGFGMLQQRDWSGNGYGYPSRVAPNDNM